MWFGCCRFEKAILKIMEVFDKSLIKDLVEYSENKSFEYKVRRVYALCVRRRHIDLAYRIEHKYSKCFPKSDMLMAFSMALMARGL